MRTLTVLALTISLSFIGQVASAQQDARHALAEELLNEMNMKATLEKSFDMVKKMMSGQLAKIKPQASLAKDDPKAAEAMEKARAKMMDKTMDMISQDMSWDSMKEDYIKIYADTFTEEELQGLIAFYKSPVGKAFIEKQPIVMEQSMKLSQQRLMQVMPKVQALTQEMLKEAKEAAKAEEPKEEK
jgi:uncharacterized protein